MHHNDLNYKVRILMKLISYTIILFYQNAIIILFYQNAIFPYAKATFGLNACLEYKSGENNCLISHRGQGHFLS